MKDNLDKLQKELDLQIGDNYMKRSKFYVRICVVALFASVVGLIGVNTEVSIKDLITFNFVLDIVRIKEIFTYIFSTMLVAAMALLVLAIGFQKKRYEEISQIKKFALYEVLVTVKKQEELLMEYSPIEDPVSLFTSYVYNAYFTVLDTGKKPIYRKWIESLIYDHENNLQYAPDAWKKFVKEGRNGIVPLAAPRMLRIPTSYEQLQCDNEGTICLDAIRSHYKDFSQGFEACATNIVSKMDTNFVDFSLTRPWRDGGRDALGFYSISTGGKVNAPLKIDCALEAKCYSSKNSVGVKEMSRLISRIRYRQFGIMITTSYVDKQAYQEVVEDGHPILIVTASDIAGVLRKNAINSSNVEEWLQSIDRRDKRLLEYYKQFNEVQRQKNLVVSKEAQQRIGL